MQIGAVQHEMRRAESLDAFVAEIEPVPCFAGAPVPQLTTLRPNLHFGERRFQAERKQDASAIGAYLDAGAHFLELVRLFVNFNVDAALEQGKRRGQSTDAGADDNGMFRRAHGDSYLAPFHLCCSRATLVRMRPLPLWGGLCTINRFCTKSQEAAQKPKNRGGLF